MKILTPLLVVFLSACSEQQRYNSVFAYSNIVIDDICTNDVGNNRHKKQHKYSTLIAKYISLKGYCIQKKFFNTESSKNLKRKRADSIASTSANTWFFWMREETAARNRCDNSLVSDFQIHQNANATTLGSILTFLKYGTFMVPTNHFDIEQASSLLTIPNTESSNSIRKSTDNKRVRRNVVQYAFGTIRELLRIPSPYDVISQPNVYNREFRLVACLFVPYHIDQEVCIEAILVNEYGYKYLHHEQHPIETIHKLEKAGAMAQQQQQEDQDNGTYKYYRVRTSSSTRTGRFVSTIFMYLFMTLVCVVRGTIMCLSRIPFRRMYRRFIRPRFRRNTAALRRNNRFNRHRVIGGDNPDNANLRFNEYLELRFLIDQGIEIIDNENDDSVVEDENSITRPDYSAMFRIMKVARRRRRQLPAHFAMPTLISNKQVAFDSCVVIENQDRVSVDCGNMIPLHNNATNCLIEPPLSPLSLHGTKSTSTSCETTPERPNNNSVKSTRHDEYCITTPVDTQLPVLNDFDMVEDEIDESEPLSSASTSTGSFSSICDIAGTSCPICLDIFEPDEYVTSCHLGCKNWFHKECLFEWLDRQSNCPYCRRMYLGSNENDNNVAVLYRERFAAIYSLLVEFSTFLGFYTH